MYKQKTNKLVLSTKYYNNRLWKITTHLHQGVFNVFSGKDTTFSKVYSKRNEIGGSWIVVNFTNQDI